MEIEQITIDGFESYNREAQIVDPACYEIYHGTCMPAGYLYVPDYEYHHKVTINGEEYDSVIKAEAVYNFEMLGLFNPTDCPVYVRVGDKVETIIEYLDLKTFGFAPFFSIDCVVFDRQKLPFDFVDNYRADNSKEKVVPYIVRMLAESLGLTVKRAGCGYSFSHKDNYVTFYHPVYEWGFGNVLCIEYRYDDILNMDVSELDPSDVRKLESECMCNPIMKETLNFEVFKRQLNDEEKMECTIAFFDNFEKFKKNGTSKH